MIAYWLDIFFNLLLLHEKKVNLTDVEVDGWEVGEGEGGLVGGILLSTANELN